MTDLTIQELENWLNFFNGITPMAEHSKENQTNPGQIVTQLIATMKREETLREWVYEYYTAIKLISRTIRSIPNECYPSEYRGVENNSK